MISQLQLNKAGVVTNLDINHLVIGLLAGNFQSEKQQRFLFW